LFTLIPRLPRPTSLPRPFVTPGLVPRSSPPWTTERACKSPMLPRPAVSLFCQCRIRRIAFFPKRIVVKEEVAFAKKNDQMVQCQERISLPEWCMAVLSVSGVAALLQILRCKGTFEGDLVLQWLLGCGSNSTLARGSSSLSYATAFSTFHFPFLLLVFPPIEGNNMVFYFTSTGKPLIPFIVRPGYLTSSSTCFPSGGSPSHYLYGQGQARE